METQRRKQGGDMNGSFYSSVWLLTFVNMDLAASLRTARLGRTGKGISVSLWIPRTLRSRASWHAAGVIWKRFSCSNVVHGRGRRVSDQRSWWASGGHFQSSRVRPEPPTDSWTGHNSTCRHSNTHACTCHRWIVFVYLFVIIVCCGHPELNPTKETHNLKVKLQYYQEIGSKPKENNWF